jgi:hypothetical protein
MFAWTDSIKAQQKEIREREQRVRKTMMEQEALHEKQQQHKQVLAQRQERRFQREQGMFKPGQGIALEDHLGSGVAMGGGYLEQPSITAHHTGIAHTGSNRALADHLGSGIAITPQNNRRGRKAVHHSYANQESGEDARRGRAAGVHNEHGRVTMVHTQHLTNEGTMQSPLNTSDEHIAGSCTAEGHHDGTRGDIVDHNKESTSWVGTDGGLGPGTSAEAGPGSTRKHYQVQGSKPMHVHSTPLSTAVLFGHGQGGYLQPEKRSPSKREPQWEPQGEEGQHKRYSGSQEYNDEYSAPTPAGVSTRHPNHRQQQSEQAQPPQLEGDPVQLSAVDNEAMRQEELRRVFDRARTKLASAIPQSNHRRARALQTKIKLLDDIAKGAMREEGADNGAGGERTNGAGGERTNGAPIDTGGPEEQDQQQGQEQGQHFYSMDGYTEHPDFAHELRHLHDDTGKDHLGVGWGALGSGYGETHDHGKSIPLKIGEVNPWEARQEQGAVLRGTREGRDQLGGGHDQWYNNRFVQPGVDDVHNSQMRYCSGVPHIKREPNRWSGAEGAPSEGHILPHNDGQIDDQQRWAVQRDERMRKVVDQEERMQADAASHGKHSVHNSSLRFHAEAHAQSPASKQHYDRESAYKVMHGDAPPAEQHYGRYVNAAMGRDQLGSGVSASL